MIKLHKSFTETVIFRLSLFILLSANLALLLIIFIEKEPPEFPLLDEAVSLLNEFGYYDLPSEAALSHGMIRGMLQAYDDPYTSFFPPPEHELQMDRLAGKFGGIGISLYLNEKNQFIMTPFDPSPSAEAGIRDGDILLSIEGIPAAEYGSTNEILAYFHGEAGTAVEIEYLDSQNTKMTVVITRKEINRPSVYSFIVHQDPDIAVIDINLIGAETPNEISSILNDLLEKDVEYFILDLQTNYGGFLSEAVEISRLFVSEGLLLQEIDSQQKITDFQADSAGAFSNLKLIALINNQTASAAEIIAGILQTYNHVPLVGGHTYLKNTVQLVFELEDTSSMHVTHAKWFIPDLPYDFEIMGLQPDITVEAAEDYNSKSIQAAVSWFLNNP